MRARPIAKGGFTLVELLVTISIIAVLAGLLLAAVHASKARAVKIACISNLRQIGLALNLYVEENGFRMPHCTMAPGADPPVAGEESMPSIRDVLASHLDGGEVFCCPADPEKKYFLREGLSYEWQSVAINGLKVDERTFDILGFQRFIMMDYDNFHGAAGEPTAKNYLYLNARAVGRLELP